MLIINAQHAIIPYIGFDTEIPSAQMQLHTGIKKIVHAAILNAE